MICCTFILRFNHFNLFFTDLVIHHIFFWVAKPVKSQLILWERFLFVIIVAKAINK